MTRKGIFGIALSFLLVLAILFSCFAFSAGAADYDVTFISVNDMLLPLNWMPYISGSVIYVPTTVFTDYGLGIHYTYFSPPATAMLYDSSHTVIFEISSGKTYDLNDEVYSASAVLRNGTVYLPLDFMCSYFGLSYSYITGSEWGNIVRVKNANVVLQDHDFQRAASSLMESRYKSYVASMSAAKATASPAEATPQPTDSANPKGHSLLLGMTGLPTAAILSDLSDKGFTCCFYLTADQILSSPDLIRGIVCSGFRIGLLVQENIGDEYAAFADVLENTAHVKSLLCTCPVGNVPEDEIEQYGLVNFSPDLVFGTGSAKGWTGAEDALSESDNCGSILLGISEDGESSLFSFLNFLNRENYTPRTPLETDG